MKAPTAPVVTVLAVLAASGCNIQVDDKGVSVDIAEGRATDEWTRRYTVATGGRVEIVNLNGTIQAGPSSGSEVEVVAAREVRTGSNEASAAILSKIEMLEEVAPDRVKIEARVDTEGRAGGFGSGSRTSITYRVGLPPGLTAVLRTENGGVRLEAGLQGSIVASSTNGGVTGRGLSGSLNASSVNGGVQMELASVTGDVEITTVNGGIRLAIPANVDAMLDARAVNGGVAVDDGLPLQATERVPLHVAGRLNAGGPRISVRTTNGGIRVTTRDAGEAR
jgi:Putative adhesin